MDPKKRNALIARRNELKTARDARKHLDTVLGCAKWAVHTDTDITRQAAIVAAQTR